MKTINLLRNIALTGIFICNSLLATAQVTIGEGKEPESFSVLELISNQKRGLRLPQMEAEHRDRMTDTFKDDETLNEKAEGLMIFNQTIGCIEYWNGSNWINLCGIVAGGAVFEPTYNTYNDDTNSLYVDAVFIAGTGDGKTRGTGEAYTDVSAGYFKYTADTEINLASNSFFHSESGLTVTIGEQTLAKGSGAISIKVSGTVDESYAGKAFDIPITLEGQQLTVRIHIGCGAYIGDKLDLAADNTANNWRQFQCFNLGADTSFDPFDPQPEIQGDKYKWGVKTVALTQVTDQQWGIYGNESWLSLQDSPTDDAPWTEVNDPCPTGWRLPTKSEWEALIGNENINYHVNIGPWHSEADPNYTTYTAGKKLGGQLMLPSTGYRMHQDGSLLNQGSAIDYWGSDAGSTDPTVGGYSMYIGRYSLIGKNGERDKNAGLPVRCIAK